MSDYTDSYRLWRTSHIMRWCMSRRYGSFLLLILCSFLIPRGTRGSSVNYTRPGDIILGGLIPLHAYDEATESCDNIRSINALKKVEAMVYAVDQINKNSYMLPNITIGFEIYDTCSYDSRTLRECLHLIPGSRRRNKPIVGVVGPQGSSSSVLASILLGLYHIPLISYLSTSDELSNQLRYPYFLRTVGPDSYQVKAIIDILRHYDWSYVSFVNSDDTYGTNALRQFTSLASQNDICIGLSQTVSRLDPNEDYDELVSNLLDAQDRYHATVVILFVQRNMVQNILSAVTIMNAERRIIWIGSDSWGNNRESAIEGNEEAALGSFSLVPASEILPEFNQYFRSLTPSTSHNPWLKEFLQYYTKCSDEDDPTITPNCNDPGLMKSLDSDISSQETLVIDAVFAFAYALNSLYRDLCRGYVCPQIESVEGKDLVQALLASNFTSLANGHVSFLPNGDVPGRYSILHLQKFSDNNYTFVPLGKWDENVDSKTVIQRKVPWYLKKSSTRNDGVPKSVCSEPCGMGERINVDGDNPCCWTCSPCRSNEIVVNNNTECWSCIDRNNMKYAWPNDNSTVCVPLSPDENSWAIGIIVTSVFGLLITMIIIILYTYNHQNALIKASSRDLSYIIFIGILLAYLTGLMYVVHPTPGVCVMRRLGPPLATSLIYVALAMKTSRLYRIFRASVKSAQRPKFISPKSQIAVTMAITAIPLLWSVICIIIYRPLVIAEMPYENERQLQVTCQRSQVTTIGLIVWNLAMALICSILAFLTRKLPENFNETRFITFCAFCSLVVFMAFSSTNITVIEAYYKDVYQALGLIVNASVTLFCLYFVKLYAIYFVKLEAWNVMFSRNASEEEKMKTEIF